MVLYGEYNTFSRAKYHIMTLKKKVDCMLDIVAQVVGMTIFVGIMVFVVRMKIQQEHTAQAQKARDQKLLSLLGGFPDFSVSKIEFLKTDDGQDFVALDLVPISGMSADKKQQREQALVDHLVQQRPDLVGVYVRKCVRP